MKMTQLLYFKTVAETGTISEAANILGVTAPAVSVAMSKLERELGGCLFEHKCNRITLNDAGRFYYEAVQQVFTLLDDAEKVLLGGVNVNKPRTNGRVFYQDPLENTCKIM